MATGIQEGGIMQPRRCPYRGATWMPYEAPVVPPSIPCSNRICDLNTNYGALLGDTGVPYICSRDREACPRGRPYIRPALDLHTMQGATLLALQHLGGIPMQLHAATQVSPGCHLQSPGYQELYKIIIIIIICINSRVLCT